MSPSSTHDGRTKARPADAFEEPKVKPADAAKVRVLPRQLPTERAAASGPGNSAVARASILGRPLELVKSWSAIRLWGRTAPCGLDQLGRVVGCSPYHLSRIFRATTGEGVAGYRNRLRVTLASASCSRTAPTTSA
ncbi:hypothetical protein ACFP3U_26890 [Kitasatospora misakiensis]|uniref:HTH araC/xylS-type domain-containing protein n=1 Tax=Kitasatospora misakiensis TaxID=67330 RepID=A0ABW0X7Q2_9ACTN